MYPTWNTLESSSQGVPAPDQFNLDQFLEAGDWVNPSLTPSRQATPGSKNYHSDGDGEHGLQDLASLTLSESQASGLPSSGNTPPSKISGRFSTEVVRTLRNWLASHRHHPYPSDEHFASLQERTGLNKTQISNWFANARRRNKTRSTPSQATSPQVPGTPTIPVDIIQRPGTPAIRPQSNFMNPLERWYDSPPEHEPATAGAIARAMATSPPPYESSLRGLDSMHDDLWQSPYNQSAASSVGTSHSSRNSVDSASSNASGSRRSLKQVHRSRKRRIRKQRNLESSTVKAVLPFQCTFCTETFKTKYDWQRHEKSLHLPVEQWVCALNGPRIVAPGSTELSCAFCCEPNPDDAHIEGHNFSICHTRSLEERTFNRKDHLKQHLQLVHDCSFLECSMDYWKVPMKEIRSRCGFCGKTMSTWADRVDHLADHFKSGKTMAHWEGDAGFDETVQAMVENAMPPYLIEYERGTPFPYEASKRPCASPTSAYEMIKIELEAWMQSYFERHGTLPANNDMQLEACRIIFASESSGAVLIDQTPRPNSWLRDLLMSSADVTKQARYGPMRLPSESSLFSLNIIGKDNPFEQCPLEAQLFSFVQYELSKGIILRDDQLQEEAWKTVGRMEEASTTPSDIFANWLVNIIYSSTEWLGPFKQRTGISQNLNHINTDVLTSSVNERPSTSVALPMSLTQRPQPDHITPIGKFPLEHYLFPTYENTSFTPLKMSDNYIAPRRFGIYFLDGADHHRRFVQDLTRWVVATMSPNNPNRHVPSDEEIQHQARWIMYDDDDPWNQTVADNGEWLKRFKGDLGVNT